MPSSAMAYAGLEGGGTCPAMSEKASEFVLWAHLAFDRKHSSSDDRACRGEDKQDSDVRTRSI